LPVAEDRHVEPRRVEPHLVGPSRAGAGLDEVELASPLEDGEVGPRLGSLGVEGRDAVPRFPIRSSQWSSGGRSRAVVRKA